MSIYAFDTPRFGTLQCTADSRAEAREIANRFPGWSNLRRTDVTRCELCDSAPCCCPSAERRYQRKRDARRLQID